MNRREILEKIVEQDGDCMGIYCYVDKCPFSALCEKEDTTAESILPKARAELAKMDAEGGGFKTQQELQKHLVTGRKVRSHSTGEVFGYTERGDLWNFTQNYEVTFTLNPLNFCTLNFCKYTEPFKHVVEVWALPAQTHYPEEDTLAMLKLNDWDKVKCEGYIKVRITVEQIEESR
jgi:hypothetical protein